MKSHRLRLWLAIVIFVLALAVIVVSVLPPTRIQQVLPVPPVVLPTSTPLSGRIFYGGI